jgi:23S rRNA (adenine2503-C2)-methyltransferase
MNPGPDPSMQSPSSNEILKFQEVLTDNKFTTIIRKSKGQDIMAACGQLVGKLQA